MRNKDDMKTMLKEAAILLIITAFAGLMLGFVHELTRKNIERQEILAVENACHEVFAQAAGFELTDAVLSGELQNELSGDGVKIGKIYHALDESKNLLGYIVESASSKGYGGTIDLYIGVTLDGRLNGVSILQINETVGFGMEAGNVLVPQYEGRKAEIFTYTKNGSSSSSEIDAISGATMTTKAFVNAVNGGIKAADELAKGGILNE